jgi:hypothetical protein
MNSGIATLLVPLMLLARVWFLTGRWIWDTPLGATSHAHVDIRELLIQKKTAVLTQDAVTA